MKRLIYMRSIICYESELEAKAMMQKEKLEDAYYPKFNVNA